MMGKTSKWFRALLGSKKLSDSSPAKDKKKQGFAKSSNGSDRSKVSYVDASSSGTYEEAIDANKHAIAVAAATAAVAEAALAAAQAAAEVVRLTSGGSSRPATAHCSGSHRRRELAAVKIQSAFRAYLARRALRALKGLVRLQALVRGHIVRKQSADMLRRMQALARIQARACSNRAHIDSLQAGSKSFKAHNAGLATPRKQDNKPRANNAKSDRSPIQKNPQSRVKNKGTNVNERTLQGSNWLNRWMEECSWNTVGDTPLMYGCPDDDKSDKILEVDTWNPHISTYRTDKVRTSQHATSCNYSDRGVMLSESLLRHSTKCRKQNPSISSGEALSLSSIKFPAQIDETAVWTTENSPQVYSASSRPESSGRKCPFTPARSECSRSFFSGYPGYPNYMANTESYRAKVRSQSAPRQRIPFEKLGSTTRFFRGYCDSDTISECGSTLHDNYRNKAYLGSGRSDRPVIPIRGNSTTSSTYAGRS